MNQELINKHKMATCLQLTSPTSNIGKIYTKDVGESRKYYKNKPQVNECFDLILGPDSSIEEEIIILNEILTKHGADQGNKVFQQKVINLLKKYNYSYLEPIKDYIYNITSPSINNRLLQALRSPPGEPGSEQYEDYYRKQWKVFINPKQMAFFEILNIILKTFKDGSIFFKVFADPFNERKPGRGMRAFNYMDPKIVIYIRDDNLKISTQQLHILIMKLDKAFGDHISRVAGFSNGGPAFCRRYNNLIYYTQGGNYESRRNCLMNLVSKNIDDRCLARLNQPANFKSQVLSGIKLPPILGNDTEKLKKLLLEQEYFPPDKNFYLYRNHLDPFNEYLNDLLNKVNRGDDVIGEFPTLLFTHNTNMYVFINMLLGNFKTIKAGPIRGSQFRYGFDSQYGEVKIIMKHKFWKRYKSGVYEGKALPEPCMNNFWCKQCYGSSEHCLKHRELFAFLHYEAINNNFRLNDENLLKKQDSLGIYDRLTGRPGCDDYSKLLKKLWLRHENMTTKEIWALNMNEKIIKKNGSRISYPSWCNIQIQVGEDVLLDDIQSVIIPKFFWNRDIKITVGGNRYNIRELLEKMNKNIINDRGEVNIWRNKLITTPGQDIRPPDYYELIREDQIHNKGGSEMAAFYYSLTDKYPDINTNQLDSDPIQYRLDNEGNSSLFATKKAPFKEEQKLYYQEVIFGALNHPQVPFGSNVDPSETNIDDIADLS